MTRPRLYDGAPLPDDPVEHARETLRRVRRSYYGGEQSLPYTIKGIRGEWRIHPTGYYEKDWRASKKRTWDVYETTDGFVSEDARKAGTKTFSTEREAQQYIEEEHRRRVDIAMSTLAAEEMIRVQQHIAATMEELQKLKAKAEAYRMLT